VDRAGLVGIALGEALGLRWAGVEPRRISRRGLLEGVGATGALTAAALTGDAAPHTTTALPVALVIGWRHPDAAERRAAALPLGFGAVVAADLAAWAVEGRPLHHAVTDHAKDWSPPFHGVADDQRAVLDAVMSTIYRHDDPTEALRSAVRLGGPGIAAVTAVIGGLLGIRRPTALDRIPWRDAVDLSAIP
jgi:hypothetical protein